MEESEIGKSGDSFIDRSKVRILLCDNDGKSCDEVCTLLCKCSYQVISVKSPRQVIDALNAEGQEIDLILSEVDLPMSKGLKMLKYIRRDKVLRRIPVIMMSAQDEVPTVVKCLKFGAADYLVKPLRTNELLNLWTHMWRRRRVLGLMEKNITSYSFDPVVSDLSDPNTNSTTLFSDDTDEKSLNSNNPEARVPIIQEDEAVLGAVALMTTPNWVRPECQPDVPGISDRRTGQMSTFPRKSKLKIGESSAFFTYIKTSKNPGASSAQVGPDSQVKDNRGTLETHFPVDDSPGTNTIPESLSTEERSCTPRVSTDISHRSISKEVSVVMSNNSPNGIIGGYTHATYPFHIPTMHNNASSTFLPQYSHIPGTGSYPFYPFSVCLQPGHLPAPHSWPSFGNPSSNEANLSKTDRREAALIKFRQKRKERCFDKKIRYVNRKKLAERRPRLRGQFVRKVNGINVDLNGHPASTENDEEEDEDQTTL